MAYSPDGKRIVSCSPDKTIRVWNAEQGSEIFALRGHSRFATSVAISPDGKRIVSGCHDGTVKVWDAVWGSETLSLKEHTASVSSVMFSPDGKRIISCSNDNRVKVWEADPEAKPRAWVVDREPKSPVSPLPGKAPAPTKTVELPAPAIKNPPSFRVTEVSLRADPKDYAGPAPALIRFQGKITTNGPGTVKYAFLRSDGAGTKTLTLTFNEAGTREVSTSWQLGVKHAGWQALHILVPNDVLSEKASFKVDFSK